MRAFRPPQLTPTVTADGWVDAAAAFDPISSLGIGFSLRSGMEAPRVAAAAIERDEAPAAALHSVDCPYLRRLPDAFAPHLSRGATLATSSVLGTPSRIAKSPGRRHQDQDQRPSSHFAASSGVRIAPSSAASNKPRLTRVCIGGEYSTLVLWPGSFTRNGTRGSDLPSIWRELR